MTGGGALQRGQRHIVLLAASAGLLILTLFAATSRRTPVFQDAPPASIQSPSPVATPTSTTSSPAGSPTAGSGSSGLGLSVFGVLAVLAIVLLVVLTLVLLAMGLGPLRASLHRRRQLPLAQPQPALGVATAADAVAEALPDLLRAVEAGSPRAGIIAAWVALQEIAADAGVLLRPSETPAERTIRMLGGLAVPGRWVLRLAELYREARFSDHPMTEADRLEAGDCLAGIASGVPTPAAPNPATQTPR